MKPILDACCGSRMFWFDKENPAVIFMDHRVLDTKLCDGRRFIIHPDVVGDFRDMPFKNASFRLIVFDISHLIPKIFYYSRAIVQLCNRLNV